MFAYAINNCSEHKAASLVLSIETINTQIMSKQKETKPEELEKDKPEQPREDNEKVQSDTGKRPEGDTNPLPPNPNKVDDHDGD